MRCTSPISVVLQYQLVSGWGLWKRRSAPPCGPCVLGRTSRCSVWEDCLVFTGHWDANNQSRQLWGKVPWSGACRYCWKASWMDYKGLLQHNLSACKLCVKLNRSECDMKLPNLVLVLLIVVVNSSGWFSMVEISDTCFLQCSEIVGWLTGGAYSLYVPIVARGCLLEQMQAES